METVGSYSDIIYPNICLLGIVQCDLLLLPTFHESGIVVHHNWIEYDGSQVLPASA